MNTRALVVSIHDVSPLTRELAERMLAGLRRIGVERCSLLVIPNHHRRGHFLDDEGFCAWLRDREAAGDEIVMHGYFHQRARRDAETLAQKFMTRIYTQDEGEFFDIGEDEAFQLVTKSQREFRDAGLNPCGFIAPAWLLSEAAERAIRRAGCEYTTRLATVTDLATGKIHNSQSMVYSVQNAWRRAASLAWNTALCRRLKTNPLARMGIHPPDLKHEKIWNQILALISQSLNKRTTATYGEWIRARRSP